MSDWGSRYGALMAERDRLIADGADPAELEVPMPPPATPPAGETAEASREAFMAYVFKDGGLEPPRGTWDGIEDRLLAFEAAIRAEYEGQLDSWLRKVGRAEADERVRALREAATTLVRAYDAHNDALNGEGHKGEPHNRDLWRPMPGDMQIYDQVGDCSACGGAQYGTEDAIQQAIVDVKVAIGEPLRPYESFRAALSDAAPEDASA